MTSQSGKREAETQLCAHEIVNDFGHADACNKPAVGVAWHEEDEPHWYPACEEHRWEQAEPLSHRLYGHSVDEIAEALREIGYVLATPQLLDTLAGERTAAQAERDRLLNDVVERLRDWDSGEPGRVTHAEDAMDAADFIEREFGAAA